MADRPLGVTIICILQFIAAIILIALGAIFTLILAILVPLLAILGVFILVLGIISFIVTFGLWNLKNWAFWLTIIVNVISIVTGIATGVYAGDPSAFTGIIIPLIVVIYLFTVREHFR
jgi:uncharacterized membrane protein (DUF2068 family)